MSAMAELEVLAMEAEEANFMPFLLSCRHPDYPRADFEKTLETALQTLASLFSEMNAHCLELKRGTSDPLIIRGLELGCAKAKLGFFAEYVSEGAKHWIAAQHAY